MIDNIENDCDVSKSEKDKQKDKMKSLLFGDGYNQNDNRAPRILLNGNTGKYYNSEILQTTKEASKRNFKGAKRIKNAYDLFFKEIEERKSRLIEQGVCSDASDFYKKNM